MILCRAFSTSFFVIYINIPYTDNLGKSFLPFVKVKSIFYLLLLIGAVVKIAKRRF